MSRENYKTNVKPLHRNFLMTLTINVKQKVYTKQRKQQLYISMN